MTRREFGSILMAAGVREQAVRGLAAYLQAQIDASVVPGAKVAARRHGVPLAEIYLGSYCDLRRRDNPCEASAIHSLASVSKMVTATAVTLAWQDGLVSLDAPVAEYVPEFAARGKGKITLRQCLTHSAGIPTAPEMKSLDTDEHWKQTVAQVCDKDPEWEPGSRTVYHGMTGPLMAAEAVRRRMGGRKSWNAICRERVFEPAGLSSFTFEAPPPGKSVVLNSPPADLSQGPAILRSLFNNPGGGLMGDIGDVLRFLRFQNLGGVTAGGRRLLQEKFWTEMHTDQFRGKPAPARGAPGFDRWGLGMMLRGEGRTRGGMAWFGITERCGPRYFSHVGISTAMAAGDPDADLEIAFLATAVPTAKEKATEMRCKVADSIYDAIA